jgi:cell division protein FtsW
MSLVSKLFKGDKGVWFIFMFLCLISLVEVFSATSTIAYKNAQHWAPIMRHGTFLLAGFGAILLIENVEEKYFKYAVVVLPISLFLLMLTQFMGETTNGSQRWLNLAGISFQPSELAKLSLIITVAFILSKKNNITEAARFKWLVCIILVTCALIFFDNLSTAVLLFVVCYLMMLIGGVSIIKLLKLAGFLSALALMLFVIIRYTPKDIAEKYLPDRAITWQNRLKNSGEKIDYSNPTEYKLNDGNYQKTHAQIAIARGGIIGKLPGHGQQRDFLPQAYSDFIYAIIIEELGLVGGFAVLFLYIALMIRVGVIARKCEKKFSRILVMGCGLLIGVQALINMSVAVVDIMPVTGQPLPLISRGGTSTLITCVYFGIILSISRFDANMGNEEDDLENESSVDDSNPLPIQYESNEQSETVV